MRKQTRLTYPMAPWWRNTITMWEIALAAPQVIAHRSARLAAAGASPSARDQREFARMGQEKLEAFAESWLAMGMRVWQAQQAMAAALTQQWMRPSLALATAAAGLKPVHRRVTANARRLSRPSAGSRRRRTG